MNKYDVKTAKIMLSLEVKSFAIGVGKAILKEGEKNAINKATKKLERNELLRTREKRRKQLKKFITFHWF